ncbi:hypothetical protein BpHYR1_031335 [Brachionus plicatilis]|uniref:Uncharacterized protein n=1 Tax=Brachionus plicatilis TaxID=10195 RepID=A0A3M7SYP4_BRAPC|nr:hypothetical protein BpHYR1_031335 [Brachionus plicatilis]
MDELLSQFESLNLIPSTRKKKTNRKSCRRSMVQLLVEMKGALVDILACHGQLVLSRQQTNNFLSQNLYSVDTKLDAAIFENRLALGIFLHDAFVPILYLYFNKIIKIVIKKMEIGQAARKFYHFLQEKNENLHKFGHSLAKSYKEINKSISKIRYNTLLQAKLGLLPINQDNTSQNQTFLSVNFCENTIFQTFILPYFDYGSTLLCFFSKEAIIKLAKINNFNEINNFLEKYGLYAVVV